MTKKNTQRQGAKITEFAVKSEGKELIFRVQDPTFEQLAYATSKFTKVTGEIDLAGAGKAIWDTCVTEFDKEIEDKPILLIGACLKITEEYVQGIDVEVEKKNK